MPTFALADGPQLVGFLTLREHFPEAWDIHCVAIRADARGQGHGSRLLTHVEAWRGGIAALIEAGDYSPTTANGWLSILRVIVKQARRELGMDSGGITGRAPAMVVDLATRRATRPSAC